MSTKYEATRTEHAYFITITIMGWVNILTRLNQKQIIIQALHCNQSQKGLEIYGYCIMHSHIHLLCKATNGFTLSDVMRDFKKYTSNKIIRTIIEEPESRREWMLDYFKEACQHLKQEQQYKVWKNGYHAEHIYSNKFIKQKMMRTYRETKNNGISSLIDSITVIKSFVRESLEAKRHQHIQFEMTENQMATLKTSFSFESIKSFTEQIGLVIIIILTAYFVLNGSITIGAIMFHIMLFNNVSAPIRQLHRIYDEVNDALIYSEGFFKILESETQKEISGSYKPKNITGLIEVRNVDFVYQNGTKALENVNFTIKPNENSALVGLSGAGKSTIINILDKFYQSTNGQILSDGVDLKEYDTAFLRRNIGLVLQKKSHFQRNNCRKHFTW